MRDDSSEDVNGLGIGCAIDSVVVDCGMTSQCHERKDEHTIDSLLDRMREQDEVIQQQRVTILSLKTTIEKHERLSELLLQPRYYDKLERIQDAQTTLKLDQLNLEEGRLETQASHILQHSELLEKINDLIEDIEDKDTTINILIVKDRSQTDIINSSHKALVEVLGNSIHDFLGQKIGVRYMGAIDEVAWNCAYQKRYQDEDSLNKVRDKWIARIQNPSWFPLKVEESGGMSGYRIDEDDPWVTELHQDLGDELYKIVVDALIETETCNASGRTPVALPWHFDLSKQLDFDEAIYFLGDCIEYLRDECEQHRYQSNLPGNA